MAGLTDIYEQRMLDHIFNDAAYTFPVTLFIGLSKDTPTEAGAGYTEPSTGGYARVSTTAGVWSSATGTAPATKTNGLTITFPTASGDWSGQSNMTHFVLFTSVTATASTEVIGFGALTTPKPVLNGDTASFAASSFVWELGDPSDSY